MGMFAMWPYYQPGCAISNRIEWYRYSNAGRNAVSVTSDLRFNHSDFTIYDHTVPYTHWSLCII